MLRFCHLTPHNRLFLGLSALFIQGAFQIPCVQLSIINNIRNANLTMKHAVRISLIILLGTAAFLASGCSEPDTTLPYSIEIEEEKAGRITSETPFDASHIASLMPGFDVKPYTAFSAGMPHTVLRVSRHERPIMSIMPTPDGKRVHSVTVHDPEVTAQRRVHVGR